MAQTNPLIEVQKHGQSLWYDFISRDLLLSGELRRLVEEDGVLGVTSNPCHLREGHRRLHRLRPGHRRRRFARSR